MQELYLIPAPTEFARQWVRYHPRIKRLSAFLQKRSYVSQTLTARCSMESRVDRSHTLAVYALLLAAALILSYIEALLPPLGIFKLGLANIAVTLGVYIKSRRCGFVIMLCRVFITSLLFGSATTFAFSLLGGLFAWIIAVLLVPLYRKEKITLVGISVLSAAAHNIGQVIAACILLSTTAPVTMLSWLLLASIPAGLLTGITSQIIINRIGDKL